MKKILIILLLGFSVGCANNIKLTENQNENTQILKQHIPVGTSVSKAKKVMENNGFICSIQYNESINLVKGNILIGNIEGNFLCCEKEEERHWDVIFILENDKVKDITNSSRKIDKN